MTTPAKSLLPIVNPSSSKTTGSGCGTGCGCSKDDAEMTQRLQTLRQELRELVTRSREEGVESSALLGDRREATLSLAQPLPLWSDLSHRAVDDQHVWVGVHEGVFVVLDGEEHAVFQQLKDGHAPAAVRAALAASRGISEPEAWESLSGLIGRLATAGMIQGIRGYVERKVPTPERFARLHLTQACQLECTHCYADSSPWVDRTGELPAERWARLITEFAAQGGEQILFTGGEALMHKGCIDLLRVSKENGLYVTLFTNGILVRQHARELHQYTDKVQISLDGPDAPTNDDIRGNGMYKRIVRAIDTLVEQGTAIRIGMTAVPAQWDRWKENFLRFAEPYMQHPHVEFKLSYGIMQYGRGSNFDTYDPYRGDPSVIDTFLDKINGQEGPMITRTKAGCGYGEQVVCGPDGTVYPCHLLDAPVCHIDDYPVTEIISTLRGLSRQIDVDHVEGCNTCDIRYLCGGTCRVIDSRKTGSRLITTCTAEDKEQKYRNLVRVYAVH